MKNKYSKYKVFSGFIWVFFHDHSRITELQWKEEDIFLNPHYHFHLLHRDLLQKLSDYC